jgi:AcrR family transcriptional regulator
MDFKLSFSVNNAIYLRNPESSELGKKIVKQSIDLINQLGFEAFTFKKLAKAVDTTEASVYRYFENKHRLLLYIINWYWHYMDFLMDFHLQNVKDNKKKIQIIIQLLTKELPESTSGLDYNIKLLHEIVLAECSKVYLTKEVEVINRSEVFKPYKDLCAKIALVISSYDQKYPFPKSLSSTLIESAHQQQYFVAFLPRLTDVNKKNNKDFTSRFLENLVFSSLNKS